MGIADNAPMTRSTLRTSEVVTANGGDPEDAISALSSPFDGLNQRIIRLLQDDGRAAYDAIGQKLGVSGGTVRNRIARMREAGMLRIVAMVDPVAAAYESDAMLGIKTAPGTTPAEIAQRLESHPAVVYIMWVGGRFDLLVEVVCDEETELAPFLNAHIHGHPDIAHVEVMARIGMFKNQFLLKRHAPSASGAPGEPA
ncbi:MAG: AsnC family transcriptional regulator [Thiotrichales bacterium]|nr:AsnC family transcriptional regulator [Thiotrichales bacterium]